VAAAYSRSSAVGLVEQDLAAAHGEAWRAERRGAAVEDRAAQAFTAAATRRAGTAFGDIRQQLGIRNARRQPKRGEESAGLAVAAVAADAGAGRAAVAADCIVAKELAVAQV